MKYFRKDLDGKVIEVSEGSLRSALAEAFVRDIDAGRRIFTPQGVFYRRCVLTRLEEKMMEVMGERICAEYGFSDVELDDVAEQMKESVNVVRGVEGGLIRKDLIWIEESDTGFVKNNYIHLSAAGYCYLGREEEIE